MEQEPNEQSESATETDFTQLSAAPCGLGETLKKRGFEALTPIQAAVIEENATGRNLRLTSQTGSGKTVAVGLAMAELVKDAPSRRGVAHPTALVIAPTRELANQLGRELGWLYADLGKRVQVVTGGTSYTVERREMQAGAHVLVGTPGRLLDHLRRDAVNLDLLKVVVLDEADEMLDMGFEEELDGILGFAPPEADRLTHLVSATFTGAAKRLANRLQKNPVDIEGTPLGAANSDIDHRCVLAHPSDQLDIIVNLLLRFEGEKTLIFVRTRLDTTGLARRLADIGFSAMALNGEMTQRERTSTFDRFRKGSVRVLVATDVAARGLDVHDIGMVIQVDLPDNAEALTHRSGRTGRAGRHGRNVLLVSPRARRRVESLLRHAKIRAGFIDPPDPESIRAAADARLVAAIREPGDMPAHIHTLAAELLAEMEPQEAVARLLNRIGHEGPTQPRTIGAPRKASRKGTKRDPRDHDDRRPRHERPARHERSERPARPERARPERTDAPRHESKRPERPSAPRPERPERTERPAHLQTTSGEADGSAPPGRGRFAKSVGTSFAKSKRGSRGRDGEFVSYQVSWGEEKGADPRRLLALVCRRGGVDRGDVGAIRVGPRSSTVEVTKETAERFERSVKKPDRRDAHVRFRRWVPGSQRDK
ncbi:MAG: DEAD/DEAH box helicase [Polyangiales bacterium]